MSASRAARASLLAELRRGARQVPRRRRGAPASTSRPRRIRCSAATARRWRWTWRATGRADAEVAARSSAAPATASKASAARACRSRCCATRPGATRARDAGVAVLYIHALNPVRLLVVAAHDARERRPEPQLPRLHASRCRATPPTTSSPRCSCRRHWPPTRRRSSAARRASSPSTASAALQQAISGGQYDASRRPVLRRHDADLEPRRRCARCCASTATRCARLAWIDLHTGLGPSGLGERIFACRDDAAALARARAWWGDERHLDLRRLVDLGAADRHDVAAPPTRNAPQAEYTGIALEYGTLPHATRCWTRCAPTSGSRTTPRPTTRTRRAIKQQMRDAFYIDTDEWKAAHRRAGARRGRPGGARARGAPAQPA